MTGAVEHSDCLPDIIPEPHPVKQPSKGVKCPLNPLRVNVRNQAFVRIKGGGALKILPPSSVHTYHASRNQQDPVVQHCVHNHIKNGRGNGSPWVIPQKPWNPFPYYPPTRATIINLSQYWWRIRQACGPNV